MKFLALAALFTLSFSSFALTDTKVCEKEARLEIAKAGFDTSEPATKKLGVRLNSGESVTSFDRQIGPYGQDKIVFFFQGDEAGWFEIAAVMNPSTCKMEELVQLYIE